MIVVYKNDFFDLEMSFHLFESIKRTRPSEEVEITSRTSSTYVEKKSVMIGELEDYSIARNLAALA